MMTFYAAIGSYRIHNENGHKVAYIQKLGKLHPISIPEFAIWSTLLWEVMSYTELKKSYDQQMSSFPGKTPDFDELLSILIRRKLIARGMGYTGVDALYNMLSDAFVVPYHITTGRKTLQVLKLWAKGSITISDLIRMMKAPACTADENRVIDLVEQTPLSTSEIIRCFERNLTDVSTADKVIAGIYGDEDSDQSRIANEEFNAIQKRAVLQAVSNLYLKRKVLLELA